MKNIKDFDDYVIENKFTDWVGDKWQDAKYELGKLGSITKGGKLIGKGKIDDESKKQLDKMLEDASNGMIKHMDAAIKKEIPEFPNNKKRDDFLNGLSVIAQLYDSIVAAHNTTIEKQLSPEDKGYMSADMANSLIKSLRLYMKRLIDYDLSTSYTVFEKEELDRLEELEKLDEGMFDWFKKKKPEEPKNKYGGPMNAQDTETATKKMVDSRTIEKALIGIGAALGVLGWICQTDWFKDLLEAWFNKPQIDGSIVQKGVENLKFEVKPGDGFTQTLNHIFGSNLGPNSTGKDLTDLLNTKLGTSNPLDALNNLGIGATSPNPEFASQAAQILQDNPGGKLSDIFVKGLPTGGEGGTLFQLNPGKFLANKIVTTVVKFVVKKAITTGTEIAAGAVIAGQILVGVGIVLVAAGVTSWLLKIKAKKSSRFKDLQELLEKMVLVTGDPNKKPEEEKERNLNRTLQYIQLLAFAGIKFEKLLGLEKLPLFSEDEIESLYNPKKEKNKKSFVKVLKDNKTTLDDKKIEELYSDKIVVAIAKYAVGNRKASGKDSFIYRLCQQFPELGAEMRDIRFVKKFDNVPDLKGLSGREQKDYYEKKDFGPLEIAKKAEATKTFSERVNDTLKYIKLGPSHIKTLKNTENFSKFLEKVKTMYSKKFSYKTDDVAKIVNDLKESKKISGYNDFVK